jgi:hypothetical protein
MERAPSPINKDTIPITPESIFIFDQMPVVKRLHPDYTTQQLLEVLEGNWEEQTAATVQSYQRKADQWQRMRALEAQGKIPSNMVHPSSLGPSLYHRFIQHQMELTRVQLHETKGGRTIKLGEA